MRKEETTEIAAATRSEDQKRGGGVLSRLLKINYRAIDPKVRGFSECHPQSVGRIKCIGSAFLDGYHRALATRETDELCEQLNLIDDELRGFAYEGAGMGVAILDFLSPWRRKRFPDFLASADGDRHLYMLYVGLGWACTRLPGSPERVAQGSDSLMAWLVLDGCGFHEGFFHHRKYLGSPRRPKRLSEYGKRVFDQGLGRSLWFVCGGDARQVANSIGDLAPTRHADLWGGVGLGTAYAGGRDRADVERLAELGAEFMGELAQGASFGAKARLRGGNLSEHTEMACEVLCEASATEAASVTDEVLAAIDQTCGGESYEAWRQGIIHHYTNK
jgi:hypothetical protein